MDRKDIPSLPSEEDIEAIQQSILDALSGKRGVEHERVMYHKHFSPKAVAKKRKRRKLTKQAKRRNRR